MPLSIQDHDRLIRPLHGKREQVEFLLTLIPAARALQCPSIVTMTPQLPVTL